MLFEDILPVACLPLSSKEYYCINYDGRETIETIKSSKCRRDGKDVSMLRLDNRKESLEALNAFRESIADLGLVTLASDKKGKVPAITILNCVNARTLLQNYRVKFRVGQDLVDDMVIRNVPFHPDGQEILELLGVTTLRKLVNKSYASCLKMLGCTDHEDLYEVILLLREICVFSFNSDLKVPFVSHDVPKDVIAIGHAFREELSFYDFDISVEEFITPLNSLAELIAEKHINTLDPQQCFSDVELMTAVYSLPDFTDLAQRVVDSVLEDNDWRGLTLKDIDSLLPLSMRTVGCSSKHVQKLLEDGRIEEYCSRYYVKRQSLMEYVESIEDDTLAQIAKYRLEGKSPTAIGTLLIIPLRELKYTILDIWRDSMGTSEDKYTYWFSRYKFRKEELCQILDVPEYVFHYLTDVFRMGNADIQDILVNPEATEEMKSRVQAVLDVRQRKQKKKEERALSNTEKPQKSRSRKQSTNPEELRSKRLSVLRKAIQSIHREGPYGLSYLLDLFLWYCKENNLSGAFLKKISEQVLEDCFMARECRDFIVSSRECARQYDMDAPSNQKLIADLHLEKYNNLMVSALMIYEANYRKIRAHDIRNFSEFEFWLRKQQDAFPFKIEFKYSSMLAIGDVNLREQIIGVMKKNAPMPRKQLTALLRKKYGLEIGYSTNVWLKEVEDLLVDGEYRLDGFKHSAE